MEATTMNRLSGSILEDRRPIREAIKDPVYQIRRAADRIAEQNYRALRETPDLLERFFRLVDSPAPQWEIEWRFGIGERHYWELVLNLDLR